MDNSLFIKKVCGLVCMGVLGLAIIITAFVFGREESEIETDNNNDKTTTTTTVTTTFANESKDNTTTTTTAPSESDEISTTTVPMVTEDTRATTTTTSTKKSPQSTTSTTKKTVETTTTAVTTKKATTTTAQTTTKKPETTTQKPVQTSGSLEISANITNSWEEGGKKCSQIDVVIKNNTSSAKDGWTAVLNFNGNIEVSNGWNGSFSANGSKLTVTPAEYNSKVEAGSEVTFGVIVSCDGDVKITSASV